MDLDLLKTVLPAHTVRALANRDLWRRGDLRHLVRPGAQEMAYDFIQDVRLLDPSSAAPIVCNIRRGAGKTFLQAILAWEVCLSTPGAVAFLVFPQLKQGLGISELAIQFLMTSAPPDLRPHPSEGGALFRFHNGSVFRILGAKEDAHNLRGFRANYVGIDECADFDQPEYVIRDVITPFFTNRPDPFFSVTSTPPKITGHWFSTHLVPQAIEDRRYICIPASRDPSFTEIEETKMLSVFRSKESSAWRRELECELIADESVLAIPSFTKNKHALVRASERPAYFYPFVFADIGYIDPTGVLFCYIDFERQKLVVEDEIFGSSIGTRRLADLIKAKESELYRTEAAGVEQWIPHYENIRRWADATPRELDDLRSLGCLFSAAKTGDEKWDKWSGLARLETLCMDLRVEINPRCRNTIFQLENAIKNKQHTDLQRIPPEGNQDPSSPVMGHADLLWALAYGAWQIRPWWLRNPFPAYVDTRHYHTVPASVSRAPGQLLIQDFNLKVGDCSDCLK